MSKSDDKKRFAADQHFLRGAARWMGIGFEFLIVIGLCVWGGYKLDQIEGTAPGWMILGFLVGFGIMLYIIVQRARKENAEEQAEKQAQYEQERKEEQKQHEASKPSS